MVDMDWIYLPQDSNVWAVVNAVLNSHVSYNAVNLLTIERPISGGASSFLCNTG